MISFVSTRARTAAALTALAATMVGAAAPAHASDAAPPALTAVSLETANPVTAGAPVTFGYQATDDGATLASIELEYSDSYGRTSYWVLGTEVPVSGTRTLAVPEGLPNEVLRAEAVRLVDSSGNIRRFRRDGAVCVDAYCGYGTHGVSLAPLDLLMTGSTPDTMLPVLSDVATPTPHRTVGEQAILTMAVDEAHPSTSGPYRGFTAEFEHVENGYFALTLRESEGNRGTLVGPIPDSVPNGTYRLRSISARDAVGNTGTYRKDYVERSRGTTGPTSHTIPFADITITVSGSSADVEPPTLSSLSYTKGVLPLGGVGSITIQAADDRSGVASVDLELEEITQAFPPHTWTFHAVVSGASTATGPVPQVRVGRYSLKYITVKDKAGRYRIYQPDGRTSCEMYCPGTHDLDFSALTAVVATTPAAPGSTTAAPGDASARVSWYAASNDGFSPVTGYTVSVSPGGKTYNASASSRAITIGGLSNNVRHTFTVRARNAVGLGAGLSNFATPRQDQRLFAGGDANHDGRPDIMAVSKAGTTYLYRGTGTGKVRTAVKIGSALPATRLMSNAVWRSSEDLFTGSSIGVDYSGRLAVYYNSYPGGALKLAAWPATSVFQKYRMVAAPGDLTGDGMADVLGITDAGDLYLHKARTDYTAFYSPKRIGGGWGAFTSVVGVGDLNGDRRNDLVTRKKDGTLWLYAGNGRGGFYAKQIGSSTSWKYYAQLSGVGDFNGDRRNDLLAVTPGGTIYLFKGNGRGGFSAKSTVASGFSSFL